jgi:hypothetical protein
MFSSAQSQLLHDQLPDFLADLSLLANQVARNLREAVVSAMRQRDIAALNDLLDHSATLQPDVALRAVWVPIVLGLDAWNAAGGPLPDGRCLARTLRAQARSAQLSLPALPVTCWLIPATEHDTTAAHLAVLALSLRGLGARVWTWPMPPPGSAFLVGDAESPVVTAGRIPTLSDEPSWPQLPILAA